ncbi:MAG: hypothetical protein WBA05_10230 [Gordonia sp. (in: high G+C Gram-positive bacteria)]|uniref:hypothetical protein n=1 Tax=Gordonia TaxID=2053 RepID=UPI00326520D2
MAPSVRFGRAWRESGRLALDAVRSATPRQALTAAVVALTVGLFVGWATVLIPNDVFGRDIAPVAWNYPVLVAASLLSGLLAATYVSVDSTGTGDGRDCSSDAGSGRLGGLGAVASWFAVGCPVCNKLALLAFGYAGAQTWFAPMQPVLAVAGLGLLWTAIAVRLQVREQCPVRVGGATDGR